MKQFFKFTLATIVGLFVFGLLIVIIGISSLAGLSGTTPIVSPNSVYELKLSGILVERSEDDPFSTAMAEATGRKTEQTIGLDDVLANIEKAKSDDNIVGIYLHGGSLQASFASLKEIREAMLDFKSAGKFIVAYADNYTQSNYYLASVADTLWLNAQGMIDWRGLSTVLSFYKNTLEKVGIEMQVVKVGTFKSAVEPYVNTQMSEANRLQTTAMLKDIWQSILQEISESRQISVENLNAYADRNMLFQQVEEYKDLQFVDSLVYANDIDSLLNNLAGKDYALLSHETLCNVPTKKKYKEDKVAVVYAYGAIEDNSGNGINAEKLIETLSDVTNNDNIKAVVLRVNSPGGSAYASEQIWHALQVLKERKPLIVSMGDYAASGGYYISCMADSIVAQPTTITGSIGIFGLVPNVSGLLSNIGVAHDGVNTNKMSDMSTNIVLKGMNPEERALMQGYVNRGYELFVKRCAEGRGMSVEAIKAIGEGRVWTGNAALANGLVDTLGTLNDAINIAAEKAELTDYERVDYPAKKDFATRLLESFDMSATVDKIAKARLGAQYEQFRLLRDVQQRQGIQAIMPYNLEIK